MTTLVNLRTCKNADVIRIDRRSIFGNPYRIGQFYGQDNGTIVLSPVKQPWAPEKITRKIAIALYKTYFYDRLSWDPEFRIRVMELRGHKLACWCRPLACHGEVIMEFLNNGEEV